MFKKESFEAELMKSMADNLSDIAVEQNFKVSRIEKAAECLNTAASIFDEIGFTKEAEQTTLTLEVLASRNKKNKKDKDKKSKKKEKVEEEKEEDVNNVSDMDLHSMFGEDILVAKIKKALHEAETSEDFMTVAVIKKNLKAILDDLKKSPAEKLLDQRKDDVSDADDVSKDDIDSLMNELNDDGFDFEDEDDLFLGRF